MRSLCAAACLALSSTSVLAADFGIGISAKSDDALIYAPINVSKTLRLEPSLRYVSNESSSSQDAFGVEQTFKQETDTLEIGIGVFGLKQVAESAQLYYGARLAYVDRTSTSTLTASFGFGDEEFERSELSQDGYRVGPVIGFEYLFGKHFSVGGEASYDFIDIEGDVTETSSFGPSDTVLDVEQQSQGTATHLIFRYMF